MEWLYLLARQGPAKDIFDRRMAYGYALAIREELLKEFPPDPSTLRP